MKVTWTFRVNKGAVQIRAHPDFHRDNTSHQNDFLTFEVVFREAYFTHWNYQGRFRMIGFHGLMVDKLISGVKHFG